MKQKNLVISFLIFSHTLWAQNEVPLPSTGLKVGYLGSLVYPGFKIGMERPIKITVVEKQKKDRVKIFNKERYLTLNMGFYHHKTFHSNLFLLAEWQRRRQNSNGWFSEFAPGIGFSSTFLAGTTYQVSDNGEVSQKTLAGYNYAMVSLAAGVGYDFSKKTNSPIKAYLKPSLLLMAPYNNFIYTRLTAEIGIIYSPSNFLKSNPSFKTKKK